MKQLDTAKEIFSVGRHRTITVEEAEQKFANSVGSSRERFICTVCGEYVAFVRRYEYKSYFKHGFSNETTIQCEKRSISQTYQSIYERIGLPLYLRKYMDERYELCVGFYTLDELLINKAEKEGLKVTINATNTGSDLTVSYFVNKNNYLTNDTTLKKIDYIFTQYTLNYSSPQLESSFHIKWGRNIEGILSHGALFTYHEYGGRKIRTNDEITTDVNYLYLCLNENLLNRHSGIIHEYYGTISLKTRYKNMTYNIYKILFKSNNDTEFDKLYKFCRNYFNISLLYKPSKLFAVWPPTVTSDNHISCIYKKETLFILRSDEKDASIFLHKGPRIEELHGTSAESNRLLRLPVLRESKIEITLNGKYNSINTIVTQFKGEIKTYGNIVSVKDNDGNLLNSGEYTKLPYQKSIKIESESKCDVLLINNNRVDLYRIRDSGSISINPISHGDEIFTIINSQLIKYMNFVEEGSKQRVQINDDDMFSKLHRLRSSSMKHPPFWIKRLLTLLGNYPKTNRLIMTFMKTNKMPASAEKMLSELIYELKDGVDK